MAERSTQNAAQSPRYNQNRENKFKSEPKAQGRDLAARGQTHSPNGFDNQVAIGTINTKSKKRVQFILEETQENDESNTAALSEANPSQSIDDYNRLDTLGSSVQDQYIPKARNLQASFATNRPGVRLQRQRPQHSRIQKQALREFERKARAERKNAEEIAYQFIYNQNKQLIQREMAASPENGKAPTDGRQDERSAVSGHQMEAGKERKE